MDFSSSYSLYCPENASSWDSAAAGNNSGEVWPSPAFDLISLLSAEAEQILCFNYLSPSAEATARHDSINWILKVIDYYRFNPVTAYLAVNYLDRFLSANSLPAVQEQNGWPIQLLSVACLSIAAKMEETNVPLLLDLQILGPKYLFEPKTIRRMELILMAALQWRLRAITPFDFLPHFSSRPAVLSRAADLIIGTCCVVDFVKFRPSAIAGAAVLCAAAEISKSPAVEDGDYFSCFSEWLGRDDLGDCRQLMDQYLVGTYRSPSPRSPVGVLDPVACGSCDTSSTTGIVKGESPPPSKRRRLAKSPCTHSI